MAAKSWYLFTYDVRDDKRLRKVAKTLEGYGTRMQYSVFRCYLSPRAMQELRWELAKLIEPEDDLLVIGLCGACIDRIRSLNGSEAWPDDPHGTMVL